MPNTKQKKPKAHHEMSLLEICQEIDERDAEVRRLEVELGKVQSQLAQARSEARLRLSRKGVEALSIEPDPKIGTPGYILAMVGDKLIVRPYLTE